MAGTDISTIASQQEWIDPIATTIQDTVAQAIDSSGSAGLAAADFLSGKWLGHSLHQVLTDIPIGAWTAGVLLDSYVSVTGKQELADGADAVIGVGLLGAVGAAMAGLVDYRATDEQSTKRLGAAHAITNVAATALFAGSWFLRRSGNRTFGQALSYVGLAVVGAGAYMGGSLVVGKKIGVDHSDTENTVSDWTNVMEYSSLVEGTMTKVDINGMAVLLANSKGTVYALSNSCSHLGGPLNEGELADGCVTCPWHKSVFRLEDGSVAHSPAVFPQPRLDVRIIDGQIMVKSGEAPLG